MLQSEQINELVKALALAQTTLTAPTKNRKVVVKSRKTGVEFSYSYMTLDELIEHVRKPLTDNGLWFIQAVANTDGKYGLHTKLVHSSGQWIMSETPILVESKDPQEFGGAITYMRRYSLAALLGVAADDDADGGDTKERKERGAKTEKPPKLSPEEEAKQWIGRQKDIISGFNSRALVKEWRAKNVKSMDNLNADFPGMHEAFMTWIDGQYSDLP